MSKSLLCRIYLALLVCIAFLDRGWTAPAHIHSPTMFLAVISSRQILHESKIPTKTCSQTSEIQARGIFSSAVPRAPSLVHCTVVQRRPSSPLGIKALVVRNPRHTVYFLRRSPVGRLVLSPYEICCILERPPGSLGSSRRICQSSTLRVGRLPSSQGKK